SGANTIRVTAASGFTAELNGSFFGRNGGTTGTVNFDLNAGAAVKFRDVPPQVFAGVMGRSDNGLGYALVNGADWATYEAAAGVRAFTAYTDVTGALPAGADTLNARLSGNATVGAGGTATNTLKILADATGTLDITGAGSLTTRAILVTGAGGYTIRQN